MRLRNRLAIAAVAALVALHAGAWFWASGEAASQLDRWAGALHAQGWNLTYSKAGRAGWPLSAFTRITDIHLDGPLGLTADAADLGGSLLHPTQATLRLDGTLRLTLGNLPVLTLQAQRLEAGVPLGQGPHPDRVDIDAAQLRITEGGAERVSVQQAHLQLSRPPSAGRLPMLAFTLQAGPARLPDPPAPEAPSPLLALGTMIQRLDIAGTVDMPVVQPAGPAAAAIAWRDAGGTLRLSLAAFEWGPLHAAGQATATLDPTLQPTGQARLRLSGFTETLNALTAGHVIPARTATAAGAVLALLARPGPDGTMEVEAPLTLQDHMLQFGRIPILRLPILQWQSAP